MFRQDRQVQQYRYVKNEIFDYIFPVNLSEGNGCDESLMAKYKKLGFNFLKTVEEKTILPLGIFILPEKTFLVIDTTNGSQWIEYDGRKILTFRILRRDFPPVPEFLD
jgi:hypothetical protein